MKYKVDIITLPEETMCYTSAEIGIRREDEKMYFDPVKKHLTLFVCSKVFMADVKAAMTEPFLSQFWGYHKWCVEKCKKMNEED